MSDPLKEYEPRVASRRRHPRVTTSLDDYVLKNGTSALRKSNIRLLTRECLLHGQYEAVTLDRRIAKMEGDQPLIIYKENGLAETVLSLNDLQRYKHHLVSLHPIRPEGRSAEEDDVKQAFEALLGERFAVHMLQHLLTKEEPNKEKKGEKGGKKGGKNENGRITSHEEYEGKDLIIENNDRYVLKRKWTGEIVLLERHRRRKDGKFGYTVAAEIDGFIEYTNDEKHAFIVESKQGKVDLSIKHVIRDIIGPLQELYPRTQLHYAIFSHHAAQVVGNRHLAREYGRAREKEQHLTAALLENDVTPHLFSHPIRRSEFRELVDHVILQYKKYKWLPIDLYTRARVRKNEITIYRPDGEPMYLLRKRDKRRWEETEE